MDNVSMVHATMRITEDTMLSQIKPARERQTLHDSTSAPDTFKITETESTTEVVHCQGGNGMGG
jgi:hypothetical protein